jgi:hypothetical protein
MNRELRNIFEPTRNEVEDTGEDYLVKSCIICAVRLI